MEVNKKKEDNKNECCNCDLCRNSDFLYLAEIRQIAKELQRGICTSPLSFIFKHSEMMFE